MQLVMDKWVKPHVDVTNWEFYDLSCISRDKTEDKVLKDAVDAGKRIGAIFKVFLNMFSVSHFVQSLHRPFLLNPDCHYMLVSRNLL